MKRMKLPVILLSLVFFFTGVSQAQQHKAHSGDNRFGSHGMALLTDGENLYASHMPLYRRPHDVQLIYKIEVEAQTLALLQNNKQSLVSLLPDNFDLNVLINGKPLEINADIYKGHFERGGELWLDDISVSFVQRLYLRSLQSESLQESTSSAMHDLVELPGKHSLLVRQITKAPAVDSLLLLEAVGPGSCKTPKVLLSLALVNAPEKRFSQQHINSALENCYAVTDSYWETADFAK